MHFNESDNVDEKERIEKQLNMGYSNEYSKLESVFIHIPRRNELIVKDFNAAMFQSVPSYTQVLKEVNVYIHLLKSLDIVVYDDSLFNVCNSFPNLIFVRDLAVITKDSVFLANPKYNIRKGEEEYLCMALRRLLYNDDIVKLPKDVSMEGADFLWIDENSVIISVGNRTCIEFIDIFKERYPKIDIRVVDAPPEGIPQHILGAVHILDKDTIIQRKGVISYDFGFNNVIELEENEEVRNGYAMNILTIGPMEIIMPSGNPQTKKIYEDNGIRVHESPASEIGKMGGAFACMTLPLKRNT